MLQDSSQLDAIREKFMKQKWTGVVISASFSIIYVDLLRSIHYFFGI